MSFSHTPEGRRQPHTMNRKGSAVVLVTVFAVNFLSLVYQVIWTRNIMAIFGSTALSVSTTLTVFLSGIALGGYLGGKWIRKIDNKRRAVGILLAVLGGYCFFVGYLFQVIDLIFGLFHGIESAVLTNLLKLFFTFLILIFPTTIIGSIFPITTYLYSVETGKLGKDVAFIYFLDTFGAALGALISGFILVPMVGLRESSFISAALYILLGILMFVMKGSAQEAAPARQAQAKKPVQLDSVRVFILAALFFSGFSALVLEVVWARYFHLIFGTSIYAFSIVIAAFLMGLSIGSFLIKRRLENMLDPVLVFAYIEILIGGFALLVIRSSEWLEVLYYKLFYLIDSFYVFQAALFTIAFVIMLIPAALMGANFPLAIKIFGRDTETRGEDAGLTFSFNTAGGIIGAFAAGFIIIPLLGLEKTNFLAFAGYLAIGFAALFIAKRQALHYALCTGAAVVFITGGYLFGSAPSLNYGVYYGGIRHKTIESFLNYKKRMESEITYSKHGFYGLVSVRYNPATRETQILHNGKVDATNSLRDMPLQVMLGHVPLFFHKNPERVLNIGLGGGFTLGAIKSHPNVKQIDMVEIDPLVVEATGRYFREFNNDALADPRISIHVHDGRHFLKTAPNKYDVIVSEPPNIWVSGVSMLFTREFYKIVDDHLNPGGILSQWVPGYEMDVDDLKLILRTIKERFEYVTFWMLKSDVIIFASHTEPVIDPAYIAALLQVPKIGSDVNVSLSESTPDAVISFLSEPQVPFEQLDYYFTGMNSVNTDNLPYLEFNTARNVFHLRKELIKSNQ